MFVNGHLANHADARSMVTLKEDQSRRYVRLMDLDKISSIYCDYKEENGTKLKREPKKRKDNLKNVFAHFEKEGLLQKISFGKDCEHDKEHIKYEVKDKHLWNSLSRNYSVPKRECKVKRNLTKNCVLHILQIFFDHF